MAQAAGFTCDVCGGFEVAKPNSSSVQLPDGWMTVHPRTPRGERESIDVCSNHCLALLGKLRWECESQNDGKTFTFDAKDGKAPKGTKYLRTEEQKQKDRERQTRIRAERKAAAEQAQQVAMARQGDA